MKVHWHFFGVVITNTITARGRRRRRRRRIHSKDPTEQGHEVALHDDRVPSGHELQQYAGDARLQNKGLPQWVTRHSPQPSSRFAGGIDAGVNHHGVLLVVVVIIIGDTIMITILLPVLAERSFHTAHGESSPLLEHEFLSILTVVVRGSRIPYLIEKCHAVELDQAVTGKSIESLQGQVRPARSIDNGSELRYGTDGLQQEPQAVELDQGMIRKGYQCLNRVGDAAPVQADKGVAKGGTTLDFVAQYECGFGNIVGGIAGQLKERGNAVIEERFMCFVVVVVVNVVMVHHRRSRIVVITVTIILVVHVAIRWLRGPVVSMILIIIAIASDLTCGWLRSRNYSSDAGFG
mmetsp:Transcript_3816/g.10472  ORF Transcript_3816/g.10472 Transcript_3816/m.10472 type:complete len:349 (+) Transcript_3816:1413-2459(+)